MNILHLSISTTGLAAWAETDQFNPRAAQEGRHPFALTTVELRRALLKCGLPMRTSRKAGHRMMRIALPSVAEQPLPSQTMHNIPSPSTADHIGHWEVEVLQPNEHELMAFISTCGQPQDLGDDTKVGADATYWAQALRFALGLTARQSFAPTIEHIHQRAYARWQPIIQGMDRTTFSHLAAAMPASARALFDRDTIEGTYLAPRTALRFAVQQLMDQTVRTAYNSPHFGQQPKYGADRPAKQHQNLIHALTKQGSSLLMGSQSSIQDITDDIEDWRIPLHTRRHSPARFCLRLEPPDQDSEDQSTWALRYLFQALHDPTLLIDASNIWDGHDLDLITEPGFDFQQFVMSELDAAANIFKPLEQSLHEEKPTHTLMDTSQAHAFMAEYAAPLVDSGVRVLLPELWDCDTQQVRISATARALRNLHNGAAAGMAALIEFDWRVAVGDQTITPDDMERLANAKVPLIRMGKRWLDLTSEQIQTAVRRWQSRPKSGLTARNLLPALLAPDDNFSDLDIQPTGWLKSLAQQLNNHDTIQPSPKPAALNGTLRPYQLRGYSWLKWLTGWGLGACLADDMGLGKTIQTLALMLADTEAGHNGPYLVVCPASLLGNWEHEAAMFAPSLGVHIHHDHKRAQSAAELTSRRQHAKLVITTYGTMRQDDNLLADIHWRILALDEAQNIKNPDARQAQSARKLTADCRIALTGTPVENHVGDLWGIMDFLNPGLLGSRDTFRKQYLIPIRNYDDQHAAQRLHQLTAPFFLRRLKSDPEIAPDLPEKFENRVHCTLTKEQASLYAAVLKELDERLDSAVGIQRQGLIFRTTTRLKQVCNHPAQLVRDKQADIPGRSGKLTRLVELTHEALQNGHKAIVFTQYVQMGHILTRELERTTDTEVPFLHGSVPPKTRNLMVDQFQTDDQTRLMVVSLRAGGNGLNLTAASHVFHYDRWWNPAVENQASDRAFRIGQTRDVQVHKFVCIGTLEEKIDQIIEQKKDLAGRLITPGDDWLANLSNSELRDVLTLSANAE